MFKYVFVFLLFNISRSLPSLGARCTPMRAARPAVCPLLGSTWPETPLCWSATCCWPTPGSTIVKLRLGESTTGARSTSLCWVSVGRHIVIDTQSGHEETQTHLYTLIYTHTDLISGSLAWHISSVMLTVLMIQFDSDSVIWFSLMLFGFVWIGLLMRWDQKHATGSGRTWLIMLESELQGQASS